MSDARILWPADTVDPRVWWGWLAGELGCSPALDRPFLICLRGVAPFASETHPMRSVAAYDDTGILLFRGGERVFPMSSHAYQVNSKLSPDVDGDGLGDVGTIKPGRYLARDLNTGKYPTFLVSMPDGDGHLPCWRDADHDGVISHGEMAKAFTATQILIHGGVDDPPDSPHHFSIGCQCVPLAHRTFLVDRAKATGGGLLDYRLLDVADVLTLMAKSPFLATAPENVA